MNNTDSEQAYGSNDVFGDEMSDAGCSSASVLLERIERSNNEAVILCNVIELCQLLVMGSEETLTGFPTKRSVPCLTNLLRTESNFEITLHACRALQYLIEVLPRSTQVVLEAVPALLEKLQVVECVDVAEQSLQVLDLLSKKHSKVILKQNGIASCLKFIDFFSTSAQRTSLSIVSNCCLVVTKDDFHLVRDSLPILSARLLVQDKKSVESVCLSFSRLVENLKNNPEKLEEVSNENLFRNLQHLLLESPGIASSSTFVVILRMLNILSSASSRLYLHLLRSDIGNTLLQLLIGPLKTNEASQQHFELVSRSAQEIFEIISLISNLLPPAPHNGIFSINSSIFSSSSDDFVDCSSTSVVWQWCDSKGIWHSYSGSDSRIIEVAHRMGEPEIGMSLMGRMYTIDFQMMQQINEETGTSRPVQRTLTCSRSQSSLEAARLRISPRRDACLSCREETSALVALLLPVVYEVFCTTASMAVKHKCLQTLLRMVLHSDALNLRCILKNVPISSSIAGMLTSYDTRTIVTAIQLCHILMERLPDVFSVFFQRQGVLHQMLHLAQTGLYDSSSASPSTSSSSNNKGISYQKEHLQRPGDRQKGNCQSDPSPQSSRPLSKDGHQSDQNPQRSKPAFGFLPPQSVPSSRYNKSSCQVRFQMSEEMSSSLHDASLLTVSTPAVFHPQGRGTAFDDAAAAVAVSTASSPTSLSSPSSPSISAAADVEPQRSSLIQVRLTDVLKSKKSSYRLLKEEPPLFRFGPIRSEGSSQETTNLQTSCRDYSSHSAAASPPHHHSTPSVYMPSKNLGSLVSQRIASISSAASSSSSSAVQSPSYHRNNNNSNHLCNGDKSGRINSPPSSSSSSSSRQQNQQQQAQQSSASSVSNSYVSATKARLFGNKELTCGSKSSSLTFPRSLLASLNPKKWAKFSTTSNQKSVGKDSPQSKPIEPLQKKVANSKEVINAWVIQNASLFMDKYFNRPVQSYPHPSLNILSQLSSTLLNLGNILTDEEQLRSLSQLLSNNDISPFELVQSSFIDLMTSYLTSDLTTLKFQRLRIFLHVFLECPKTEYMSTEDVWASAFSSSHSPIHHLVAKLINCFHHLEKFQLKTSDHSSAFRSSLASDPNTYRFYKADLVKCSLQLHPSCSGSTNHWNVGLVRIDPFAIVQSLESILTQTIKIADSDLSEDEDDFEEQMSTEATEHEGYHSMSSSSSSSSLTSPTPAQSKGFEFHIGNNLVPEGMTVFQAIKRFSANKKSQKDSATADGPFVHLGSSSALNREHHIWSAEHTIWFKPKGLMPANPQTEAPSTSKSTPIVIHPRKAKFEPSMTIHQHNLQLHRYRQFQQGHHHQQQQQHQQHHHSRHRRGSRQSPSSRRRHNYQHLHLQFEVPSFGGHRNSTSSSSSSSSSSSRGNASLSSVSTSPKLNLTSLQQQHINLNDPSIPVLSLLRIIHSVVTNWHLLYRVLNWSDMDFVDKKVVNSCDFISNKLTSKLMKQLQDPIVLLSGSLPLWVSHVPIICPFLLSFQTRHHLFCLTCLDKGRALLKFNERTSEPSSSSSSSSAGDGHRSGGRINCRVERVKKVIKRKRILEQAEHVMSDMVGSSAILEIKYEDEIGFGLGPTLEFYALVSQKVQRSDLNMWISCQDHFTFVEESDDFKDSLSEFPTEAGQRSPRAEVHPGEVGHVVPPSPFLHPLPLPDDVDGEKLRGVLDRFEFLGRFMAKSLVDSRLVDLPLSPMFYKWLLGEERSADLSDLRHVDVGLYGSLMKLQSIINNKKVIENSSHLTLEEKKEQINKLTLDGSTLNDLCLTFTLPGYENFELLPGGSNEQVTIDNLEQYIELVVHWMLVRGIYRQMAAFKLGFETFLPLSSLQFFYADELDRLFCGSHRKEEWTVKYLSEVCRPDHGYTPDSPAVQLLYTVLSSFDRQQQRMFIQFVTGSPRLPVGGLKSLSPPLTIVRKTTEHGLNPDDFLPSVMTCVNYLKLPDYSTLEVMKRKLDVAVTEGRLSFHLS